MSWWAPTEEEVQAEAGARAQRAVVTFQRRAEQREQQVAEAVAAAVTRQDRTPDETVRLQERLARLAEQHPALD